MWESLRRITHERCRIGPWGYKRHSGFQTSLLFTTVAENIASNNSVLTCIILWWSRWEREQVRWAVRQGHGTWNCWGRHRNGNRTRSMALLERRTPNWRWIRRGTTVRHETRSRLAFNPLYWSVKVRSANLARRNASRRQEHSTAALWTRLALRVLKRCRSVRGHLANWRTISTAARSVWPICSVSWAVEVVKEDVYFVWWQELVRLNQIHIVPCTVRGCGLHSFATVWVFVLLAKSRVNPSMFRGCTFHLQSCDSRKTFKRTEVLLRANKTQNCQSSINLNGLISPKTITTGNNR